MKKAALTNKFLVILLITAMTISLGGTFLSLSILGRIGSPYISAHATSAEGNTKITIASALSISMVDWDVDYGTCWPLSSGGKYYDSDDPSLFGSEPGKCNGPNLQTGDTLRVINDGNQDANVTIKTNDNQIVGSPNTSLWFRAYNSSVDPGCYRINSSWTNFTGTNDEYFGCSNLSHTVNLNKFDTAFRIWIPFDTLPGEQTAIITFTAHSVS
jgi:hypothetical protein